MLGPGKSWHAAKGDCARRARGYVVRTASNTETVYIGPRKVSVWPNRQPITVVAESIRSTCFDDASTYHSALIEKILEHEAVLRRTSPPPTRCLGGQKIRKDTLEQWDSPELNLLNARAKAFFRRVIGADEAHIDGVWVNVYRQWESIGPHCHRRTRASLVYCLDAGDDDPDCPLSGRFAFVDPRIEACCQFEAGHMTNPLYPDFKSGTMLVFPGFVLHSVAAYSGVRPRITMAWNINDRPLPGSLKDAYDGATSVAAGPRRACTSAA